MGGSQSRADPSGVYGIGQADALAVTVGCAIGVSGMLIVLAANTCQPLLQQPPARFVRARTTFTLLHATFLMTYASWVLATDNYDGSASQDRSCCGDGGSCADFHAASHTVSDTLETGIVLWQLVMAVDILMIVRDPFAPNRHLRKCAAFAFVGTLIGPAIMLWVHTAKMASLQSGSGESHDCPFANTLSDARFAISFLDLLVIFFATACTVLLVMRLRTGLIISQRSRHRVTRQLLVYNIGYAVADATSLGFNLLGSRSGVRFTILALRGGWDFAVWIVANHNVLFPRGCCRETLPTLPGVEMRTPFGPSPNCSFSSGSGIGVGSMDFGGRGTDWERASQLEDVPQTGERPAGTPVPLEKLDIAEELRYELVLLTAHGIGECTSDNWQQSVSTHRSSARSAHKGDGRRCGWSNRREERVQISPSSSCKEHENDETVPELVTGVSNSSLASTGGQLCFTDESDCSQCASTESRSMVGRQTSAGGWRSLLRTLLGNSSWPRKVVESRAVTDRSDAPNLSVMGQSRTAGLRPNLRVPGLNNQNIDFFDYGTKEFARVRRSVRSGSEHLDYSAAFKAVEKLMSERSLVDKRRGFREMITSGASGSYFYFTPNRHYIVKTVTKGEKDALMDMSPHYAKHCQAHPDTLIQYFGCYSIRLPLNTCKVYFVVMKNVLPAKKADYTFDLKGATSNRQRVRGKQQVQLLSGEKAPNSFSTLLDKDWMALGLRLNLPDLQELQLARVCMADAAFLSRHMCIDWSLLLGIVIKQTEAPQKWQRVFSGSNGEVYFIGFIDILERWRGCRWPLQSCMLRFFFRYVACSQWYNPEGITAIPPEQYAARFLEFMSVHIVQSDRLLPTMPNDPSRRYGKSWQPFW